MPRSSQPLKLPSLLINASDINTIFVHNQSLNANGISLSPFYRCGTIHMHLPATTPQCGRPPYRVDQLPTSGLRRRSITDAEIPRDYRALRLHSAAQHAFFRSKKFTRGKKVNVFAHTKDAMHLACAECIHRLAFKSYGHGQGTRSSTLLHPAPSTFVGNYAKVINCGVSALPADSPLSRWCAARRRWSVRWTPISRVSSRPILNPAAAAAKGAMRSEQEKDQRMGEE